MSEVIDAVIVGEGNEPSAFERADAVLSNVTAERLVKVFVKMRDRRSELKAEWERQDAKIKEQQAVVEAELMRMLDQVGADSLATEHGTAFRSVSMQVKGNDWDAYWRFAKENDCVEAFELRASKKFVKEYMDKHEGRLPPGVSIFKEATVTIRRK